MSSKSFVRPTSVVSHNCICCVTKPSVIWLALACFGWSGPELSCSACWTRLWWSLCEQILLAAHTCIVSDRNKFTHPPLLQFFLKYFHDRQAQTTWQPGSYASHPVCPSVRLSVSPSVRLSVCLPVCLSVCPSVCLHILYQLTLNHSSRLKSFTMSSSQPLVWIIFPPSIFPLVFNQRQFMWWGGAKIPDECVCVCVCPSVCLSICQSVREKKTLCCEKSYPVSESYPVKKFSCEKSYPVRKSYSVRKRYPVKSYQVRKELSSEKKWEKLEKSKKWKGVMACDVFACDNLFVIPNTCRHLTNVTRLFLLLLFVGMYLVLQTNCDRRVYVCVCVCLLPVTFIL